MTDAAYSTNITTRRPLRRAISLEDISSATSIRHQLYKSSNQNGRSGSKPQSSTSSRHPLDLSNQQRLLQFEDPLERPASSASLYHRRQRSHPTDTELEVSILSLRDHQPLSMSPGKIEAFDQISHDSGSLPTPEVSPEELSDSSDELVIIQGEVLEEARSSRSVDRFRPSGSFPEAGMDTATIADASTIGNGEVANGPFGWLVDSPFIDALVNWIEGPDQPGQPKSQEKDSKPNPLLDIPLQFIALLTYPEPDPKNGNKMTLAMVRETSFVRQRRKTLMMLTFYTLVVRYCSFDFFILVLFASNCAMLFLMKNSGKMNVNMAKRAVRQRVGWAKQWAGSIFKRGGGVPNTPGNNNNNNNNQTYSNISYPTGSHSPSISEINRSIHCSSPIMGDTTNSNLTIDTSPQKRRGLFGKRKTVDNSQNFASGASSQVAFAGDNTSILSVAPTTTTSAAQKKRFFRRNNTTNTNTNTNTSTSGNTNSNSANTSSSMPVPIPKRGTTSGVPGSSAKTVIMNVPLSSSPTPQPQSLPQPQLSPVKPYYPSASGSNEGEETRQHSKSLSITSTPPPLRTSPHYSRPRQGSIAGLDSGPASLLSSPGGVSSGNTTPINQTSCETVAMPVPTSTPQMVSGLSQLLGRSYPTTPKNQWDDSGEENHELEMEMESRYTRERRDGNKTTPTFGAVTSASAEAMEV
ncbi:hypothetical protein BGZ76_008634 [Entomortierella beljakovae]|nr:hypothetical protein BGZ76_008634 [Entomortierella beljakovae]